MSRIIILVLLIVSVMSLYTYTLEKKLNKYEKEMYSLSLSISEYKNRLEDNEVQLEVIASTYALTKDLVELRESMASVVASATVIVNKESQANINSVRELKRSIENEDPSNNSLHHDVIKWLQQYEESRGSSF